MIEKLRRYLPSSLAERLLFLGPALILAVEASGENGITEVLGVGAEYGFALLWVIIGTLFFKFAFTNGIARYTVAKGDTIFNGLRSVPGPENWEVVFILVIYVFEIIGFGGIILVAAMFLNFLLNGVVPTLVIAIVTVGVISVILWKDSYERFEHIIMLMAFILIFGAVFSLLGIPLQPDFVMEGLIPSIPDGSLIEVMALMGAIGSGLNILLYSVWLKEKIGDRRGEVYFTKHMRSVNLDLALAFLFVGFVAFVFMSIGFFAFTGEEETVPSHMIEVLSAFMDMIPYGVPVFFLTGYFILSGAVMSGMDGRARAISSVLRENSGLVVSEKTLYRLTLIGFLIIIVLALNFGEPHKLIHYVSAFASVMFALLGFMLLYIDSKLPAYAKGSRLWQVVVGLGSIIFLLVALMKEEMILAFGLPLIERIAVVAILIYVFTKTEMFRRTLTGRLSVGDKVWIVLIFGALSIYGTYRGIQFDGLIVNFRDLGPIIAGAVGGPLVGGLAGIIGGSYRLALGGWTGVACSVATVVAGILAGYYSRYLKGSFSYFKAVCLVIIVEFIHIMVIVPIFTDFSSFDAYVGVIRTTLLPMIITNSVGFILFLYILRERGIELAEHKKLEECCDANLYDDTDNNEKDEGRV